jgi:hypothetical protein
VVLGAVAVGYGGLLVAVGALLLDVAAWRFGRASRGRGRPLA